MDYGTDLCYFRPAKNDIIFAKDNLGMRFFYIVVEITFIIFFYCVMEPKTGALREFFDSQDFTDFREKLKV